MEYLDNTGRQRLGDALRDSIDDGAKLSIIASYFTVFAFGELKDELSKVDELRFIFDEPTFAKQMESEKDPREFVVRRRSREKGVGGATARHLQDGQAARHDRHDRQLPRG